MYLGRTTLSKFLIQQLTGIPGANDLGALLIDVAAAIKAISAMTAKGALGGYLPHQLIMTATPIPRTLAMTAYADLDVSVIDELPPGRQPITTVAISSQRRDQVLARIGEACRPARARTGCAR